jgi:hypothetical protein
VCFTVLARQVFAVFRRFHRDPGAIRLVMTIFRQTKSHFNRRLRAFLGDLGWDSGHAGRAAGQLRDTLMALKELEIVTNFEIDAEKDAVRIGWCREWGVEEARTGGDPG